MTDGPYESPETEFWYNVMPQAAMPVAGEIENDFDVNRVAAFVAAAAKDAKTDFSEQVKAALLKDPSIFHDLRQLLGISDKRAYLELSYLTSRVRHPSAATGICGCQPWNMARHPIEFFLRLIAPSSPTQIRERAAGVLTKYLLREGLSNAAKGFAGLTPSQLTVIYETLVIPRENQQKAAKRRGHGCEGALATVLHQCGVHILPEDKYVNAMGAKDPNLDRRSLKVAPKKQGNTYSFDMLVLDGDDVRVGIQSLIHTSDPGQYGVNKSDETVDIALHFRKANESQRKRSPIELWGLVDGVGFSENKPDTINKMIHYFDCFVQLNTLYKAPLRLHQLGLCRVKAIRFADGYSSEDVEAICKKYVAKGITLLGQKENADPSWTEIAAGRAVVYCH